jgi:hypothetical protein
MWSANLKTAGRRYAVKRWNELQMSESICCRIEEAEEEMLGRLT